MSESKSEIISIFLAIPQDFLCNGVKSIFSPFDDIRIVGELDSFDNLADSIKTYLPEILIISTSERNSSVFDVIKTIKISNPEVSVIIMLENFEDESIYTALGLSISACLTTSVDSDELVTCIRKVWHGENPIFDTLTRPGIARLIVKGMESDHTGDITDADGIRKTLSNREKEILNLVADEYTLDQIISHLQSSENDIIQHLTDIYGKLIFNNFCEFSAQTSEKLITQDQSQVTDLMIGSSDARTTDISTPDSAIERVDGIDKNDIRDAYTETAWEGFEALKKELQETLDKLATGNDYLDKLATGKYYLDNLPEEEHIELSGAGEEGITGIVDTGEDIPEVMPEPQKADDIDIIDQEHILKSGQFPEEMDIQNSENDKNILAVRTAGESDYLPPDTSETINELEVEENEVPVKQKSKWFRFSRGRDDKSVIKNNKPSGNNDSPENTATREKPGLGSGEGPDSAKDKEKPPKKRKGDSKYSAQTGDKYSQEEILSSVKGMGVPVFIKTPVDAKQLEKLESIVKKMDNLTFVLHKGTVQEHVVVISGQEPASLLRILNDIPVVENASEENGIINIRLLPIADTAGLS